jgi:hypothetical protein
MITYDNFKFENIHINFLFLIQIDFYKSQLEHRYFCCLYSLPFFVVFLRIIMKDIYIFFI